MLTLARLKECLDYNPDTGVFVWIKPPKRMSSKIGMRAGSMSDGRYRRIQIDGRYYFESHLAYLYVYGDWPPKNMEIDHINRNCADNRISNLRLATRAQNLTNRVNKRRKVENYGLPVGVIPQGKKFRASCRVDKKTVHIGTYNTPEEAHNAYCVYVSSIRGMVLPCL